ncbi:hypothetical protein F5Y01DRAFT_278081 [Xylaria sp. FL0043]|nr:hypothetical protein F5Y01DRAFT_278081 [Xylaria sp. FL0043]
MERFLKDEGWKARILPWQAFPDAAGIEYDQIPCIDTIKTAMNACGWFKCVACTKFWVNSDTANVRDWFAREQLHELGLDSENYRHIRYSDEVYFKYRPEGKVNITRQRGERYCTDCI